jgi:hypothetical protein
MQFVADRKLSTCMDRPLGLRAWNRPSMVSGGVLSFALASAKRVNRSAKRRFTTAA